LVGDGGTNSCLWVCLARPGGGGLVLPVGDEGGGGRENRGGGIGGFFCFFFGRSTPLLRGDEGE